MTSPLRIVFAGTPEFAATALARLIGSGHCICAVYTQPDRPAGRGRKLTPSPVKSLAAENGLAVYQPASLNSAAVRDQLRAHRADVMIVAAYGLILPRTVLDIPRLGCLNIHASLLPRWRGAAPIQRAIVAGDTETGITIMQMDAGLDTGPMLRKKSCPITADDTAQTLHDRLAVLGADALIAVLEQLDSSTLPAEPQDNSAATYAAKIHKEEAQIDWQLSAAELARRVRAFNSWPVAYTQWRGRMLRIWQAEAETAAGRAAPGQVIDADANGIRVATGAGLLNLKQVQLPGRRPVSAAEFLNAHSLKGERLGS